MNGLSGKNAIVTGARTGIGRAVVRKLAERGVNIWACASKYDAGFEEDMKALTGGYGSNPFTLTCGLRMRSEAR